jgi:hypothetical protein
VVSTTPRPLYPLERPGTHCVQEAGWATGPVWTCAKNLDPTGIRSPDNPAHSQSLYRLTSPDPIDSGGGKTISWLLEGMSTHRIAVSHKIRMVDITHVPAVPLHDVTFHWVVADVTAISFCGWWVHVSQHVNFSSVLPN